MGYILLDPLNVRDRLATRNQQVLSGEAKPMTVCIAAVCDAGQGVVVAADRMFTNPGTGVEFETEEQKIEQLGSRCVAMAAGNSVHATEVLYSVRNRLGGNQNPDIVQVAELIREEYFAVRSRKIDEAIFAPNLGSEFIRYRANGGILPNYLERQPMILQQFMGAANQFNLGLEFLVAGVDNSGAHVFIVSHPGMAHWLDKLGYAAIGSGAIHATTRLSLSGQTRQKALFEAMAQVYSAKRISEVAPGVGKTTDLAIVRNAGPVHACTQPILTQLELLHATITAQPSFDLTPLQEICNAQWANP